MHVSAIKGRHPTRESNDDSPMVISNYRICDIKTSGNGKYLMSWSRRRRRNNNNNNNSSNNNNAASESRSNDNCNYSTTNDFNKINKLLLITYMLLITAATICQSAAQSPSSSNGNGVGGSGSTGGSPLSALLKSGGASYNQQLPQQQLFAMLTRNGGGSSGPRSSGSNRGYTSARQHFMALSEDYSDADVDEEDMAALHYPLSASHPPAGVQGSSSSSGISIQSGSLETNGFVADDGGQYEHAQKALEAAAAAAKASNKYNIDCPKDCKCLNVLFDCDKLHLERVPVLPSYVQTL